MKMRRGWPENLPAENIAELQQILTCLQRRMQFEKAVLFGRYAGGRMHSETGGYELLLITVSDPELDGWQLEEYIKTECRIEFSSEWMLHIETVGLHYMNDINTASWFFWNIRIDGTIVYDRGDASHGLFTSTIFQYTKAYRAARTSYEYYFKTGSRMLDAIEWLWSENQHAPVAILFSYAALFLLRAEETVFFGNFIHTGNLQRIFLRARHFSRALIREFKMTNRFDAAFFDKLAGLRHIPRIYDGFSLPEGRYRFYLKKLRKMESIVQSSCERHLFYLEHGKAKKEWMEMNRPDVQPEEPTVEEAAVPEGADWVSENENTARAGQTQQITIEVDPVIAFKVLGLVKGYFPSIVEQIELQNRVHMDEGRKQRMLDALDEIYRRCLEKADVQEVADLYLRSELSGKFN